MFLGEYHTTFTGQGRIILPKKFRSELDGSQIVLSRGFEGCIWGFALEDFASEAKKQLAIPVTEKIGRNIRRYLFSGAENVRVDGQGRFVIPTPLLSYARLKKEVVIAGAGDHFEIWDAVTWERLIKKILR